MPGVTVARVPTTAAAAARAVRIFIAPCSPSVGELGSAGGQIKTTPASFPGNSYLLIHVDLDRARQHRAPGLHETLQPRVAGDALAVDLDRLVGLIFDHLGEAGRVVHVLKQAHPRGAEEVV